MLFQRNLGGSSISPGDNQTVNTIFGRHSELKITTKGARLASFVFALPFSCCFFCKLTIMLGCFLFPKEEETQTHG